MSYNEAVEKQLSVRVPRRLDQRLEVLARRLGLKRSALIRAAIERFVADEDQDFEPTPYERTKHLLGSYESPPRARREDAEGSRKRMIERIRRHANRPA